MRLGQLEFDPLENSHLFLEATLVLAGSKRPGCYSIVLVTIFLKKGILSTQCWSPEKLSLNLDDVLEVHGRMMFFFFFFFFKIFKPGTQYYSISVFYFQHGITMLP